MKKRPEPENNGAMLCISGILLVAYIALLFAGRDTIRAVLFTPREAYRTTIGTVVRSQAVPERKREGYFYYDIEYKYTVDGEAFTSTRVSFGQESEQGRRFAQSYVDKYPLGGHIQVLYLSNNPGFSVLEPEDTGLTKFSIALQAIMLITCLGGVLWFYSRLRSEKQRAAMQ